MELNLFREVLTVAGFVSFLAIAIWAYGRPAKAKFDQAAMAPILDDDRAKPTEQK